MSDLCYTLDTPINSYNGQMTDFERKKLYTWVRTYKPNCIFEIGTAGGGGSTFYIVHGLYDNKHGKLHTCDINPLNDIKHNTKLMNHMNFQQTTSTIFLPNLVNNNIIPDFIFFDGPEEPEIALDDLKFLENHIQDGCLFAMHDWETTKRKLDGGISTKCLHIRPYIEQSKNWIKLEVLSGLEKNCEANEEMDSVGLCLYMYKK